MDQLTFRLFAKTDRMFHLRLFDRDDNLLAARELDRAAIEQFAAEVESSYQRHRNAPIELAGLGRRLFEWLDGPTERWLTARLGAAEGVAVRVDVPVDGEDRLRHLPWELLFANGGFLCHNAARPFTPIRLSGQTRRDGAPANRPLRVLFMACSAEDVRPVLGYEREEMGILDAARRHAIELVVEESGSPAGLHELAQRHGRGYFDVLHLTGHADVVKDERLITGLGSVDTAPSSSGSGSGSKPDVKSIFWMENDLGYGIPVTAEHLASVFEGNWPRLIFLSGCKTAQSPEEGLLPSFCESLVLAGAPAVLGWALPVLDADASEAAGYLYEHLAAGRRVDEAVARARQRLLQSQSSEWHLLRLYADETPPAELVTPPDAPKREKIRIREARNEFLDEGSKFEVCPRNEFVGRRRVIQRSVRALRSREGDGQYAEGVLLHGMGGLGKSSLAARLCDRLPGHRRVALFGAIDEREFLFKLTTRLADQEANRILNQSLTLEQRLRQLMESPVMDRPALFVFDDFEHNLEPDAAGGHKLRPEAMTILSSLLRAIRDTASESRAIVTCRYQFPLPGPARLQAETPGTMREADLDKKLRQLDEKYPVVRSQLDARQRAKSLGAGNPRLLEWLYRVIADPATDQQAVFAAVEAKAEAFREETLLSELLARQTPECRRLIALASVYDLPVDRASIAAAAGDLPLDPHLERASALGLIEAGRFTAPSGELSHRFFASPILSPLLTGDLTDAERIEACGRAAKHLHRTRWSEANSRQAEDLAEIHRLAILASDNEIAAEVGAFLAWRLNNNSQFREAELLCLATLALGPDHRILNALARAEFVLGKTAEAAEHYDRALADCPEDDMQQRSSILFNLSNLVAQQGDVKRALDLWQQSLALKEQIGDVKGKAATLHQMAGVIAQQGDVKRALDLWQQSLALKEQIGDVKGKAATLHQMAGVIAQQGDVKRALDLWQQSLALLEQIGDVKGKAATLHNMAGVIAQQGDVKRALDLWQQSLALKEQIGDVQGKAATLSMMAGVIAQQGDVKRALDLWQQSLALMEQIGDVQGKAATLSNMAGVIAQQGDVKRALDLWQQSLALLEQIGDVQGKAATLSMMAGVIAQQGDVKRALDLWQQSLALMEQIGDVQGKAATLHNMAHLAWQQGDVAEARRLLLESAKAVASMRAWLDLATMLANIGVVDEENGLRYFAQAMWLVLHVEAPVEDSLNLSAALLQRLGVEHEAAPLVATSAVFLAQTRGEAHPDQQQLVLRAAGMLMACAEARGIGEDQLADWMAREGLNDPNRFLPALDAYLAAMAGDDAWLFDRREVAG